LTPVTGLDHVQVAAPPGCEPDARAFYGELLGLEEIEKPEPQRSRGGVWFRCGPGQQLHVGVEPQFRPSLKAHPALAVSGLDEMLAALERAGVTVTSDAGRVYTADPWGNRIELVAA
jgi:catechol 2,3-dioxygenase-like lactoylglutathione lyase family enzyme